MKRRMGTAILLVALLLTLAGCGKKKPGNDTSPTEGPTGVTGGVTEAITPTVAETVVTINAPRTEEPTPTGPVPTGIVGHPNRGDGCGRVVCIPAGNYIPLGAVRRWQV